MYIVVYRGRQMNLCMNILVVICLFFSPAITADEKDLLPKPEKRTGRSIEGWTVKIDDRLLQPECGIGVRALQVLESQLANIRSVVSSNSLEKLQKVIIVIDLDHGKLKPAQYHPSAGWLEGHGYCLLYGPVLLQLSDPSESGARYWFQWIRVKN